MSELLEVEGAHSMWYDGCGRLGQSYCFLYVGRHERCRVLLMSADGIVLSFGHIAGGVNLLAIILGSRQVLSANRTPLLGELCSSLLLRPLTSRHRCDMPVRWKHLSTAD